MTNKVTQPIHFETALSELEVLIENMGSGKLSLEDALKNFEQGISLARQCQESLKKAEQTVQILIEQNGKVQTIPFNEEK